MFKNFGKFYNSLDGLYSVIDLLFTIESMTPVNLLNNEKLEARYTPVYLESKYGNELKHTEGIFKHSNGYYIYLSREGGDLSYQFKIKIIYKVEQYEEIKIYINGLKKQK
jgi:hypothetical protein